MRSFNATDPVQRNSGCHCYYQTMPILIGFNNINGVKCKTKFYYSSIAIAYLVLTLKPSRICGAILCVSQTDRKTGRHNSLPKSYMQELDQERTEQQVQ